MLKIIALLLVPLSLATVSALGLNHGQRSQKISVTKSHPTVLVNPATLSGLPHKAASSANVSHLAPGIMAPTNSWLSGMVLQKNSQAVYPMPNSFLAKETGFELGLPTVASNAIEIDGQHAADMAIELGATSFELTRYDKISATITYYKGAQSLGNLTLAEGSPFVFYTAASGATITLVGVNPADVSEHSVHYLRFKRAGHWYVISSAMGKIGMNGGQVTVSATAGQLISFYSLPGNSDTLRSYANNAVTAVNIRRSQSGNRASTTFDFKTANGKPTVFATLPYQPVSGTSIALYDSIWGYISTTVGQSFTTSTAAIQPSHSLNLTGLTAEQEAKLVTSLQSDVAATVFDRQDSYFAGKQLARAANLLDIAEQLHQSASSDRLKSLLNAAFSRRFDTGYFYFDATLKGVAASTAAFGSEDFNDHHFHYGYWLYAGSILASYDKTFLQRNADHLNLLAADIASYKTSKDFPLYRNFDPYAGHSWAAGLAPFADGNNQESSSEAIHAWNGVSLWGRVTKNNDLQRIGQWMLAFETNTAKKAWLSVDTSDPSLVKYTSPIASLNFGGKRTYSTFFSADPSAKLGIQLLPMDPVAGPLAENSATITKNIGATIVNDNYNLPLGDYILMYSALADPSKALNLAGKQTAFDDGNSQTYLEAYIVARQR